MSLEELNEHYELRKALADLSDTIEHLRSRAEPGAQNLDGMPRASGVKDKVGDLAAEIADCTTMMEELLEAISENEARILDFISSVKDIQIRLILRLRFIRALPWKRVAAVLGGGNTENSVKVACYRYLQVDIQDDQ